MSEDRCPSFPKNKAPTGWVINKGSSEGTFQEEFVNGEVQHSAFAGRLLPSLETDVLRSALQSSASSPSLDRARTACLDDCATRPLRSRPSVRQPSLRPATTPWQPSLSSCVLSFGSGC